MFCKNCGNLLADDAVICPKCGCPTGNNNVPATQQGNKQWMVAFLLAWFLGGFGAHRFYLGQTGTAVAQLCTLGGCGIWALIDFFVLAFDKYTYGKGLKPVGYNQTLATIGVILSILGTIVSIASDVAKHS